jgi:hypothetical protein
MIFYVLELIQFILGLSIVIISYVLIMKHRDPLLDSVFEDNINVRNSFETLTSMGYFLIFVPVLLVGINIEAPLGQNIKDHIQRIIYFEAGLIFLIGILHIGITVIFSTITKKPQSNTKEE